MLYEEKDKWAQEKSQMVVDFQKARAVLDEEMGLYKREI